MNRGRRAALNSSCGSAGCFNSVTQPAPVAFAANAATQGNISPRTTASKSSLTGVVGSIGTIQFRAENAVAFLSGNVVGLDTETLPPNYYAAEEAK